MINVFHKIPPANKISCLQVDTTPGGRLETSNLTGTPFSFFNFPSAKAEP
jgi:hypothetical protein